MTLTGEQWSLVHSALLHWGSVFDRSGQPDDADRSRAIADHLDARLTPQGW